MEKFNNNLPLNIKISDIKKFNTDNIKSKVVVNDKYNCEMMRIEKHFKSIIRLYVF
jgi:hypothetical protein